MSLRVREHVWDPDSSTNADWFGTEPDSIVLLDGAAPLQPEPVSAQANDAVWLVRRFVECFQRDRDAPRAPSDMSARAERARIQLAREYQSLCAAAGGTPVESPFACLAIACERGGKVELLNMGDLTLLICRADGTVERFGDSFVR